jgi:NADPH:quinone reductase-like Zn-dependent oxidoreductase
MPWQQLRISRFGGPEVLQMVEEATIPDPGPGEVRIKVLAAGAGFTDTMIRRGRYPDFKGPLPFTPGYEIVGVVEKMGPDVTAPTEGEMVADLCVVGGYAQYAIRPARFLMPVPDGIDPAEAVCIPLAYLTAFQMLTRCRNLPLGATILVVGASGGSGASRDYWVVMMTLVFRTSLMRARSPIPLSATSHGADDRAQKRIVPCECDEQARCRQS